MNFDDRVAIITGGGTGIGRAVALQLAEAGASVLIAGRRRGPLDETAARHPAVAGLTTDVSDPADAQRLVDDAIARWDRVDVIVNNAAMMVQQELGAIEAGALSQSFATNVVGPTMLVQRALPHLHRTRGAVVNVSSTYGQKAAARIGPYAASKAALEHLTRCWALELAPKGVRVNAVAPGPTETPALSSFGLAPEAIEEVKRREREAIPLGRRGKADEVARWIVRLASPEEEWITGQVISVDGGLSVL